MALTDLEHPAATAPDAGPEVVLAEAGSPAEHRLVHDWAARTHPRAEVLTTSDPGLADRLLRGDDPLVTPVRVRWSPRRPPTAVHALLAERAQVVAGKGAHALDLQRRFREQEGGGSRQALTRFVCRQAALANDRAERAIDGDRYKVPRDVVGQIVASAAFREQAAALARDLDRPVQEVLDEAAACLTELAAVQSPRAIDAYRAFMKPLHARAWTVQTDWAALEDLRARNRERALVFLPSHRSYVDPLVLQDVLHQADFPRNHLLGGDNMAFWPLGPLGRRAGIVFIRRSFGTDRVYRFAVKTYLAHLVGKRFNLEWYLEGGRSRTGKLRPPRLGLLHYLADALEEGQAEDVLLVPTSIVYDRLPEARAMADEQSGGPGKQREGLRWWADYVRTQSRNVGSARVDFGLPISLRDALDAAGPGPTQLGKVAFRICDGINRVTPVTATSLVTLALLGVRDRALTLAEVGRVTAPLIDLLEARGASGPLVELRRPDRLRAGLDALCEAGVLERWDGGSEPVWRVAEGGHHVAAFHRNGALHHVVTRAVVELALLHLAATDEADDPVEIAWQDALRTRDLLKHEFFFPDKDAFRDECVAELDRLAPAWRDRSLSRGGAADILAGSRTLVAHRALRAFLDAQLLVSGLLADRDPRQALDRDTFLADCLGHGRQWVLQGRLHAPEAVSKELFAAALKLAANRDLTDPGREDVRVARQDWHDEVRDVVDRLHAIGELDRAALEEVLRDDVAA